MRVTDGQNYDSQDRASIAASRGKKTRLTLHTVHSVHLKTEMLVNFWQQANLVPAIRNYSEVGYSAAWHVRISTLFAANQHPVLLLSH